MPPSHRQLIPERPSACQGEERVKIEIGLYLVGKGVQSGLDPGGMVK